MLRAGGLAAQVLRTAPAFGELRVSDGGNACIVDLVAEPFGPIAAPDRAVIEGTTIQVDNRHEILASKLAAGFSPLTLAWVLKGYDPRPAAQALGWSATQTEELLSFRQWLIDWLTAGAVPE